MGWLANWTYRKSHVINSAIGAGTNYQKKIVAHYGVGEDSGEDVYLNSKCKTDFGDIRFTDDDGVTELDYWMEEKVNSDYAIFWVEVRDDLSAGNQTIYIYYGNVIATYIDTFTDLQHGENTFILFDNFEDGVYDTAKWNTISGTPVEANGYLRVHADDVLSQAILPTTSHRQKVRSRIVDNTVYGFQVCFMKNVADNEYQGYYYNPSKLFFATTYDGHATVTTLTTPTNNQWYKYEYVWRTSGGIGTQTIFSINGSVVATHTIDIPDLGDYYVRFLSYGNNVVLDVDWIFISKYVSPEPSHDAWGNEEEPFILKGFSEVGLGSEVFGIPFKAFPFGDVGSGLDSFQTPFRAMGFGDVGEGLDVFEKIIALLSKDFLDEGSGLDAFVIPYKELNFLDSGLGLDAFEKIVTLLSKGFFDVGEGVEIFVVPFKAMGFEDAGLGLDKFEKIAIGIIDKFFVDSVLGRDVFEKFVLRVPRKVFGASAPRFKLRTLFFPVEGLPAKTSKEFLGFRGDVYRKLRGIIVFVGLRKGRVRRESLNFEGTKGFLRLMYLLGDEED